MSVVFCADPHVANFATFAGTSDAGVNARARASLAALSRARALAGPGDTFVVLGDLFDTTTPSPQLLAATVDALVPLPSVHVLVGNHDRVSTTPGDHALGPLARAGMKVCDTIGYTYLANDLVLVVVPYLPGAALDHVSAALDASPRKARKILALHFGIERRGLPAYLAEGPDVVPAVPLAALILEHNVAGVFAGHWHAGAHLPTFPCPAVQVGALAPSSFRDAGFAEYGWVLEVSLEDPRPVMNTVSGPRFAVVRSTQELDFMLATCGPAASPLYLRWDAVPGKDADRAVETLRALAAADPAIVGWSVHPLEVAGPERKPLETSRAVDLDAALATYVATVPLPPSVSRTEVGALSRTYLHTPKRTP